MFLTDWLTEFTHQVFQYLGTGSRPGGTTQLRRRGCLELSFSSMYVEMFEDRTLLTDVDRFDVAAPNDTRLQASDIGVAPGVHLTNLTIEQDIHTDANDWYRFTLLRPDSLHIGAQFTHNDGDLNLEVTDADGVPLANSTSLSDNESVDLVTMPAGTYYVHVLAAGPGVSNQYSLSIDPGTLSTTRMFYVNDGSASNDYYSLVTGNDANSGLLPTAPKASVQDVLADYDVGPNDLILVDTGNYGGSTVVIAGPDEGAIYAGSPGGSNFTYGGTRWDLVDADYNLIYGMSFTGSGGTGINAHENTVNASTNNEFRNNVFSGTSTAIQIGGGEAYLLKDNMISGTGSYGFYITGGGSATIQGNTVSGRSTALFAQGGATSQVLIIGGTAAGQANSFSNGVIGIDLGSGTPNAQIVGNSVQGYSGYGIRTSTGAAIHDNEVSGSGTGINSTSSTSMIFGNLVHDNSVAGIAGAGTFGGADWSVGQPNDIYNNAIGVSTTGGATNPVRFNRIHDNAVGIDTGTNASIHHNLIYRNTVAGIRVDADQGVSITNNTIYTPVW